MPQGVQQRYMSEMPVPQLSHSTRPVLLLRLSTLGLSPSASCTGNIGMLGHAVEPSPMLRFKDLKSQHELRIWC